MAAPAAAKDYRKFCTFTVAGHLFGMEVAMVQEVLRQQTLTAVPLAPPEMAGLLNLRGQILPVIDLRRRMGFPPAEGVASSNIIFSSAEGPVDFQADQVGDVIEVESSLEEKVPEAVEGRLREVVRAVYQLKDTLLLVLDPARAADLTGKEAP